MVADALASPAGKISQSGPRLSSVSTSSDSII
jgi:hypothetical protein